MSDVYVFHTEYELNFWALWNEILVRFFGFEVLPLRSRRQAGLLSGGVA